jgi:hypothetical protein
VTTRISGHGPGSTYSSNSDSFVGTIGRDHVTVLYEQDVELQSERGRLTQLHANCQQAETAFAITARTQETLSEH